MAHFYGVEVGRNFKIGYTCESCGKTVEKKYHIKTKIGQEYNKVMWVYATHEQEAAMVEQGKVELVPLCREWKAEWDKGNYLEDSVCPFCKKHQHWDYKFSGNNRKLRKKGGLHADDIVMGIIASAVISLIAMLVVASFNTTRLTGLILLFGALFAPAAIIFFLLKKLVKNDNKKLDVEYAELEGKEKKYPYFIAWEDFWHNNIGLIRT